MKEKLISVIVPVYKVEEYLDECVESILNQTYRNLEIILVDDGSPDCCPQICEDWAKRDQRIKVVHKKNGGLSSARNAGIDVAKGDYIAFVDSDDTIRLDMYDILLQCMEENVAIVTCAVNRMRDGLLSPYSNNYTAENDGALLSIPDYLNEISKDKPDFNSAWNKLYKRSFVTKRFEEGRNNEDFLFFYELCKQHFNSGQYVKICSNPLYNYRLREGSICTVKKGSSNNFYFDVFKNLQYIIDDVKIWNPSIVDQLEFIMERVLVILADLILLYPYIKEKRPQESKEVFEWIKRSNLLQLKHKNKGYLLNFTILKYTPFLWKVYRRIKGPVK